MRRLGYLAALSGFGEAEILDMNRDRVDFWVACLSRHFAWINEQQGG